MGIEKELQEIFSLLNVFLSGFTHHSNRSHRTVRKPIRHITKDFNPSSPIRSAWKNLGDFAPGQYLNEMHKHGHYGVDMSCPMGTPVFPMASGTILSAGSSAGNADGGITINVLHANNMMTYYAHLSAINVKKGDVVDTSTQIGAVGKTGNAQHSSPHLHFEVHANVNPENPTGNWNGTAVNPGNFISIPPYGKVLSPKKQIA